MRALRWLWVVLVLFACSKVDETVAIEEEDHGGCEKDTDCKGDRICVRRKCRDADSKGTASARAAASTASTEPAEGGPAKPLPTEAPPRASASTATDQVLNPPEPNACVPLAAWSPRRGPKHAKVTILEFTDIQCPYCSKLQPALEEVEGAFRGSVAVHIRHFPLSMHANAEPAARAVQAAQRQGKGWEMADISFTNATALSEVDLGSYAARLGLDMGKFNADRASASIQREIADDKAAGTTASVTGTPTILINGKKYVGKRDLEGFRPAIEKEIVRADALIQGGTPIEKVYETLCKGP